MQRYEKYKDSGIEWLGEIPEHWEVRKIKYLFNEINERTLDGSGDLLSVSQYSGVQKKADKLNEGDLLTNASTLEGYKVVRKKQLVSNIMLAWNGSLAFSDYDGITSPAYCVYELQANNYYRYFHYLLKTDIYKSEFKRKSSGVIESRLRLYTEDFFSISSMLPSIHEQYLIANFLEDKCGKIDAAVALKEQQIEKLKELRQITIHNAVTKGISHFNGEVVPTKDSGIDWIGEIPEHWEVKPLRYLGTTQNGLSKGGEFFGHGTPFISYSDVYKNEEIPSSVNGLVKIEREEMQQYCVLEGDIFFTRTSETVEEIGLSAVATFTYDMASFAGFLIRFRPTKDTLSPLFSKYYFRSQTHRSYFVGNMNLVIRASLSQELLKGLPVLLPPLSEQEEIATYLEEQTTKIDKAIVQKQEQIVKLKEYKQSLINEAVTGKIKITA